MYEMVGTNYENEAVSATFIEVFTDRSTGGASTLLRVYWTLNESDFLKKCMTTVKLCSIRLTSNTEPVSDQNSASASPATPVSEFYQRQPLDDTELKGFQNKHHIALWTP